MATRAQPSPVTTPHGECPATAVQPAERCFPLVWRWPRPPATAGLVAVLAPDASTSWADQVLARDERGSVAWASTAAQAERYGRATLERPGVRAVSLAPAAAPPPRVGAALQVASYLARLRSGSLAPTRPCLTSPDRPAATPDDLVRIPHLAAVRAADETTTDAVMWELMTWKEARNWLGMPLPDQEFVEAHLPDLLALRSPARTGQLPATSAGQRLAGLLRGRPLPLSIQLVYRHLDLFRVLLASRGDQT